MKKCDRQMVEDGGREGEGSEARKRAARHVDVSFACKARGAHAVAHGVDDQSPITQEAAMMTAMMTACQARNGVIQNMAAPASTPQKEPMSVP